MKRILVCLAVALCGGEAVAQLQVSPVPDFDRCREFRVTNPTDRTYSLTIDYQYANGTGFQGEKRDWVWQTNSIIYPRSTTTVAKSAVPLIDCSKGWGGFTFQWRVDDITAKREDTDASREDVIRRYLEAEAARKRQAEDDARRRQAEADARALQATQQQAAQDAAKRRAAEMQQLQAANSWDELRRIIRAGDHRCDLLVGPPDRIEDARQKYNECLRRIEALNTPSYDLGPIDPSTCATPVVSKSAFTAAEAAAIDRDVTAKLEACRRARDGAATAAPSYATRDTAAIEAERYRAEQAELQRQLALEREEQQRQLAAQAAALEAERQAIIRANAQQSMTQSANDLRASNADFARQSQSLKDANAELDAFLNGN